MRPEKTTEQKLEDIWVGLLYHCKELSEFMLVYRDDPYFDTESGRDMMTYAAKLLMGHTMGLLNLGIEKKARELNGDQNEGNTIGEMLKNLGTEFDI